MKKLEVEIKTYAVIHVFEDEKHTVRTVPTTNERSISSLDLPQIAFAVEFFDQITLPTVVHDNGEKVKTERYNLGNLTYLHATKPVEINDFLRQEIKKKTGEECTLRVAIISNDENFTLDKACMVFTKDGVEVGPMPFFEGKTDIWTTHK